MLLEFQQAILWDAWLSAEIRSGYFASLSSRFLKTQRLLSFSSLILSSGAAVTIAISALPPQYAWTRFVLSATAAGFSLWSLIAKSERSAIDCADLHSRWNALAMEYGDLWGDMHADDAVERLATLRKREVEISKSSTAMPEDLKLLEEVQNNVVMHHKGAFAT